MRPAQRGLPGSHLIARWRTLRWRRRPVGGGGGGKYLSFARSLACRARARAQAPKAGGVYEAVHVYNLVVEGYPKATAVAGGYWLRWLRRRRRRLPKGSGGGGQPASLESGFKLFN
jgi:hypothetical protein